MDPSTTCQDKSSSDFDKMWQTQWFLDDMTQVCMIQWNAGEYLTIIEMVRYKGSHCPL